MVLGALFLVVVEDVVVVDVVVVVEVVVVVVVRFDVAGLILLHRFS